MTDADNYGGALAPEERRWVGDPEDGRYKDGTWTMAETRIVKRPRRYSPAPFAGYGYGKALWGTK